MKKRMCVLFIITSILSMSSCAQTHPDHELVSVPYSYSLDKATLNSQKGDLMIPIFSYSESPSLVSSKINRVYIQGGNDQLLNATVTKIEMIKDPLMQVNSQNVYGGNIQIDIEFMPIEIDQADLVIEYQDGLSERLRIGSLELADLASDFDPAVSESIRFGFIHAAANDRGEAGLSVNSIVIEIDAIDEVTLKGIDLGVPGLGIVADAIQVFNGADINRISKSVDEMTLDEEIPIAYTRRNDSQDNATCVFKLQAGQNYIVCPLTYLDENQADVKKIFARLALETASGDYIYPISSFPLYSAFRYFPEQVEALFIQASRS